MQKPKNFLEVRAHKTASLGDLCGLCVGYESTEWRVKQFAGHIMEWLPEFALNATEREALNHANAVDFLKRAAENLYKTKKYKNRGEFGELILHAAIFRAR